MNASQKQKARKAALDKMHQYKHTFKLATITYAQEKGKGKDELPAKRVCMLIKEVFKVDLCPRTIQKKSEEWRYRRILVEAWSKRNDGQTPFQKSLHPL
jgi:hypothetical protein